VGAETLHLVAFRLAGRLLGADIMQVHRVLPGETPLVEAPGAPPAVLGMIDIRGTLVVVLDLARLLQLEASHTPVGRLVVLRRSETELAAVPAEEVLGRVQLEPGELLEPPEQVADAPIRGAFYHDDELALLLDVSQLL
jgi:purine-binding chemotaxis protein CheW